MLGGVEPGDAHRAVERRRHRVRNEPVEREGERRLAASARPQDEHDLAGGDVERDAVGGRTGRAVVSDGHAVEVQQWRLGHVLAVR
ncbi:hypothetical protein GCM10025877_11280 [Agromyces mangrovi Wang et al. 2018]|nr:hypothetical protein GCM10025877_11280 [Agromyces mangrovi]